MDYIMNNALIIFLFTMVSFNLHAVSISLNGNNSIIIENNNLTKVIKLDSVINGYNVKCGGDEIVLWGKPVKFNEVNPQDTNIIIVDLSGKYKIIETGVSEGVFDVEYLRSKNSAFIDTILGYFINLSTGQLDEVKNNFDPSDDSNFEECDKRKSWEYKRYN